VYAAGDLTRSCGVNPGRILAHTARTPYPKPARAPSSGVLILAGSLAAATPATVIAASATIRPTWKSTLTLTAPCAPPEAPSSPTPTTTAPIAVHSRQVSTACISQDANRAVTARLAAMMTWTSKIGSRRSAKTWQANPVRSTTMLTRNGHCLSILMTRPGSIRPTPAAAMTGRRDEARTAIACITEPNP